MKKGRSVLALGLYWVPFVVGLGSACTYVFFLATRSGELDTGLVVTLVLGAAIGLLAVAQAIFAASDARALAESRQREKELQDRLATAHHQSQELSSHLEVLTAMREVTRILSDTVDLKQIAKGVFDVLKPLLGAEEIALILPDEQGRLVARAARRGDQTLYDADLTEDDAGGAEAEQALEHQTLVKVVDGSSACFCVPLVADGSPVGVMRFDIPMEGPHEEKEATIDEFEAVLSDIAKHLGLVVKTPTLHDRAIIDGLTGLFTRRHFDIRLDDMFRLARRYGTPFSLILMDIDRFKQVNDSYGHRAGDAALRDIAAAVTGGIRDCDSAFRYGGEEFAVLLPETPLGQTRHIAERLRKLVRNRSVETDAGAITATLSLGAAEYSPDLANHGELLALADRALYRA